ncbi:unnamed protein product [Rangifer tarandus platyrhynchus]|uniref:Uncharacterized protein n=1 Tax=Rangifer tarandus platyrhynchus TaxID=3082113 RepID=A0ABN8Y0E9_RANTA|nr:unnamed protein product [Rangifer tarandus platyrhynchus]
MAAGMGQDVCIQAARFSDYFQHVVAPKLQLSPSAAKGSSKRPSLDGTGSGAHAWTNHRGQESRRQGLARLESRADWSLESGVSPSQAIGLV